MKCYRIFITLVVTLGTSYSEIDRSYYKSDEEIDHSWDAISVKDQGSAAQRRSLNEILERSFEFKNTDDSETIDFLGRSLKKLSMPSIFQLKERFAVYDQVQSKLLSVPGHAEFFRDKIEKERVERNPKEFRSSYDRERHWNFEKLSHLPSPETIKVLGEYLSDERDAAKEAIWEPVDYFLIGLDTNSHYAFGAISAIGLRNVDFTEPDVGPEPSRNGSRPQAREEYQRALFAYSVAKREARLKPWLAWYEEVKSGQRTFSFKGQSAEYRFKPDGTWETIAMVNPPDDGPKSHQVAMVEEVRQPKKQRPTESEATRRQADQTPWLWLLAAGCLIVAGGLLAKTIKT